MPNPSKALLLVGAVLIALGILTHMQLRELRHQLTKPTKETSAMDGTPHHPDLLSRTKLTATIECGEDTVEVCTTCGVAYPEDGGQLFDESPAECKARHKAKKAEWEKLCREG